MIDIYTKFAYEQAAIPVVTGRKSKAETFAGACKTYTIEAMMGDKKALQAGTSHNLGQNFSRAFGTQVSDVTAVDITEYKLFSSCGVFFLGITCYHLLKFPLRYYVFGPAKLLVSKPDFAICLGLFKYFIIFVPASFGMQPATTYSLVVNFTPLSLIFSKWQ